MTTTKAMFQKYSLGAGMEIYWHEMILVAVRLVGKLFLSSRCYVIRNLTWVVAMVMLRKGLMYYNGQI